MNITLQQICPSVLSVTDTHNQRGELNLSDVLMDRYRLLYALRGSIEVFCEQKSVIVPEHGAFLFLPGYFYTIRSLGTKVDVIDIHFEMLVPYAEESSGKRPSRRNKPYRFLDQEILNRPTVLIPSNQTKRLLEGLVWEQQKELSFVQELSDLYLKSILISLVRDSRIQEEGNVSDAASKIMRYVRGHITENIQNDTVARELSYHPNYINRVIKKATGMTFHKYVVDEKLHYATTLLLNSDESITNIAYSLSFNTSSHFSNLFAKKYNCTPSQYRKHY